MEEQDSGMNINKWVGIAAGAVVAAMVGAVWSSVSTVNRLEPQIIQMQETQKSHSEWIREWPQTGELSTDVKQNKDLEFLALELERTNKAIADSQERIRALELEGAS